MLRKVSVVTGILDFDGIDVLVASGNDVRKRIEAGIAYRNSHSKEMVLLQELD